MRKIILFVVLTTILLYVGGLCLDLYTLQTGLIRLHVVGASNSDADQSVKLQVKDAVNRYLAILLQDAENPQEARGILAQNLSQLAQIANETLMGEGFFETVEVSLTQEAFPLREYDRFTLPSGIYETLRIRIGAAEGRNWWCVVFPALCSAQSDQELESVSAGAGFSQELTDTLTGEDYEIRFYFLDLLGQIQNFFSQCDFDLFFGQ